MKKLSLTLACIGLVLYSSAQDTIADNAERSFKQLLKNYKELHEAHELLLKQCKPEALIAGGGINTSFGLTSFLFTDVPRGIDISYRRDYLFAENAENRVVPVVEAEFFFRIDPTPFEKSKFFNYGVVKLNGTFTNSAALSLNPIGISYVDNLTEVANDQLAAVQEFAIPSAVELLLYSKIGLYAGFNIFRFANPCTKFFFVADFGGNMTFAQLDLEAATDEAQQILNNIADRIQEVESNLIDPGSAERELEMLSTITRSVAAIPQQLDAINLQPINTPIPVYLFGPSFTVGQGLPWGKENDPKRGFTIQGYIQPLLVRSNQKVTDKLYNIQQNILSEKDVSRSYLEETLGVTVLDAPVVERKRNYNSGVVNLGLRLQGQFDSFGIFAGLQYSNSIYSDKKEQFFKSIDEKNLWSYNLGFFIDFTKKRFTLCK